MLHNSQKDFIRRHIGPSNNEQQKMLMSDERRKKTETKLQKFDVDLENVRKSEHLVNEPGWVSDSFRL